MWKLGQDEGGNVAMLFGLAMMPICLLLGSAIDYGRAIEFRTFARNAGDAAALAIAGADIPDDGAKNLQLVRDRIAQRYGPIAQNVVVTGSWTSDATYAVRIQADMKAFMLPAVPDLGKQSLPIGLGVKVERIRPTYETKPPTMAQLSPEAADYNRIYMYCYNHDRRHEADKGRRGMAPLADNGTPGRIYDMSALPTCGEGEYVSYKLRNVRLARSDPRKWDDPNQSIYEYYTDTVADRGTRVLKNNLVGGKINGSGTVTAYEELDKKPILETILCDTQLQCLTKSNGGILPNDNTGSHDPKTATGGCTNGKYMYWGWEDRPGGDRDYNDIRLVTSCSNEVLKTDKKVHLIE